MFLFCCYLLPRDLLLTVAGDRVLSHCGQCFRNSNLCTIPRGNGEAALLVLLVLDRRALVSHRFVGSIVFPQVSVPPVSPPKGLKNPLIHNFFAVLKLHKALWMAKSSFNSTCETDLCLVGKCFYCRSSVQFE